MNKKSLLTVFSALFLVVSIFAFASMPAQSTEAEDVVIAHYNIDEKEKEDKTTVSVSGTSTIEVKPDQAEIYIYIETEAKTAEEAQSKNSKTSKKVMEDLENLGIEEDQIETTQYNLHQKTKWNRLLNRYDTEGYIQRHGLKVTTNDLEKVGELIDAAVDAGANRVDNIQFTLSEEKKQEVLTESLAKATKNAKLKAEAIAGALDLEISRVKSITDSTSDYYPRPMYYMDYAMAEGAVMDKAESTSISPRDVSMTANINIVFELE